MPNFKCIQMCTSMCVSEAKMQIVRILPVKCKHKLMSQDKVLTLLDTFITFIVAKMMSIDFVLVI